MKQRCCGHRSWDPYASGVSYASQGGLATLTTGDGLARTIAYNDHLQMTSVAAGSLLSLGFGYSSTQNNGNLLSQTIATPGFSATQNYGYDGANRLTAAWEGSTWGQTYVYDNVGNRAVLSSSSIPFSDATPQTGSTASVPYSAANQWTLAGYDSAGNMTAGNTQSARPETMAYDAEERMTQWAVTNPSTTVTSTYDGDGRRVSKTWNGVTTVYVYDPAGNLAAEYGGSAAPVGGTLYLTQDQLGSTRLVSNYNAATGQPEAVGCHDYLPFGEEIPWGRAGVSCYSQTADTAIKFTGQERDEESGLDNFLARYVAGQQGRFLVPDPDSIGDPAYPQIWNRYGYVSNNPLTNADRNGLFCPATGCEDDGEDDAAAAEAAAQAIWDLWRFSQQQTWNWVTQGVQQLGQQLLNNLSKPRNPNCVAGAASAGTAVGGALGLLGLAGGPAVGVTEPALLGIGSSAGAGAGVILCSSGTGNPGGGGTGNQTGKNDKFNPRDATQRKLTASQIIEKFKQAKIRSVFPSQMLTKTFEEIENLAKKWS